MRCNYIREKKYQCGDDYMAVGVFSIIPRNTGAGARSGRNPARGRRRRTKWIPCASARERR